MRKLIVPSMMAAALVSFAASVDAGPGCSSSKSASASKSCTYTKSASMPEGLKVETVRMPSGALAVLYSSDSAEAVKAMHEKAALGAESFDCGICRQMAVSSDCVVELVPFSGGVIAFVTSENPQSIDAYEKQYAALTGAEATNHSAN
jgi:hypothetical protein